MRYFFYNSFTLGSGYRFAELKDNVITTTNIPVDIDCDFCNGGCQLIVRKTQYATSILIVKGILYVNDQKKFDEQGRKVYINFAVEATDDEHEKLFNIFLAIISEWNNLSRYIGEITKIPYSQGEYGYGIEQKCFESLINYLSVYNTADILKASGIDKNDLNVIILKSSDYSYYESLAKDLYRSKQKSYNSYFKKTNIISGETFDNLKTKFSNQNYETFVQIIEKDKEQILENSAGKDEKEICTDVVLEDIDKTNITETHESQNEITNGELVKTQDDISIDKEEPYNMLNVVKPYVWIFLGFICGFLVGCLI